MNLNCVVLLSLLHLLSMTLAFNLEPRIPVVKNGRSGSYFGYSVAQHQSTLSLAGEESFSSWLVKSLSSRLIQPPQSHFFLFIPINVDHLGHILPNWFFFLSLSVCEGCFITSAHSCVCLYTEK